MVYITTWETNNCDTNMAQHLYTHREKAPSNKIQALTKSMNIDIWVVGTLNQVFIRNSY